MPRLSVYIPDELLDRARTLQEGEKTSQLVQRALERLLEDEARIPAYAQTPERSWERIIELRERLLTEARDDYEQGYAIALEAASAMSLHVINALVDANFDLAKWLTPFKNGAQSDLLQNAEPIFDSREPASAEKISEVEKLILESSSGPKPSDDRSRTKIPWWWLWKTAEALGELADPIDTDDYRFTPTTARQRGFADAMRELWSAIENPGQSGSDGLHDLAQHEEEYRRMKAEGGEKPRTMRGEDS